MTLATPSIFTATTLSHASVSLSGSSLLNRLGRKKWNVHIRARCAHGEGVAAYLARYLRGGPLKNTQILDSARDRVCFRYRPHGDEEDAGGDSITMNLTAEAFFARYLAHIPVPRLQAVLQSRPK
ncbi:MAG: transposase [Burkholderiales bacterium]